MHIGVKRKKRRAGLDGGIAAIASVAVGIVRTVTE